MQQDLSFNLGPSAENHRPAAVGLQAFPPSSRQALEQELAATREQIRELRSLLADLPEIFESRFASRLQPLLEQRQELIDHRDDLRRHLQVLAADQAAPHLAASNDVPRLGKLLRHAFGLPQSADEDNIAA